MTSKQDLYTALTVSLTHLVERTVQIFVDLAELRGSYVCPRGDTR